MTALAFMAVSPPGLKLRFRGEGSRDINKSMAKADIHKRE
jgi:hypothetical protein